MFRLNQLAGGREILSLVVAMTVAIACSDSQGTPDGTPAVVDAGADDASLTDASAVPATIPSPTKVQAVSGDGKATVTWETAAMGDLTHVVTSDPGAVSVSVSGATTAVVPGLTNGTTYTFTVVTEKDARKSDPSLPSNPIVPGLPPEIPTAVSATAGNSSAAVVWAAPGDRGLPITSYTVTSNPGGVSVVSLSADAVVGSLVNGTPYTFTVTATNAAGTSDVSAPSAAITPLGVPATPVQVTAVRADGAAIVSWPEPDSGGSTITGYLVKAKPGDQTMMTASRTAAFTGLTNGTTYAFTVAAKNSLGSSLWSSPSNTVVPAGLPPPPTGIEAVPGNGWAAIEWTTPATDNGSPILRYTITANPGGITTTTTDTGAYVNGLTNGESYTFTVTTTTSVGTSAPSATSPAATPQATGCFQHDFTVTVPLVFAFNGIGHDPQITVCRGETFRFHLVGTDGHPIFFLDSGGSQAAGVTNNGAAGTADIVWTVPTDQPGDVYYQCSRHPSMTNTFIVQ